VDVHAWPGMHDGAGCLILQKSIQITGSNCLPHLQDYLLGVPDFSLHTPLGAAQAPLLSPIRSASLSAAATSAGGSYTLKTAGNAGRH
jgi:hypothetical protein